MKNRIKAILSISLLLVVLFVASFSVFASHQHSCEQAACLACEFVRSVNDGVFALLVFIVAFALIIHVAFSRLAYIITEYKARAMTPTTLGDILRN